MDAHPELTPARSYDPAPVRLAGVDERVWGGLILTGIGSALAWSLGHASLGSALAGLVIGAAWMDGVTYGVHHLVDNHTFRGLPVLERVAFEFQMHHRYPGDVVPRGALRNNTVELALYLGVPMAGAGLLFPAGSIPGLVLLFGALFGSLVPTIHAWAHHPRHPSRVVRLLQSAGLLLSPREHARHHRGEGSEYRSYALLNGWSNTLLDRFFSGPPRR